VLPEAARGDKADLPAAGGAANRGAAVGP